ncbi:MAG: glycosyltransferase [Deltaproteobacteria bacterium]|nr:glycosyltransferase [Deltaproteobacteria bacterium]
MAALLIIFAKEPLPGQVKTRLSPPLSAAAAARLYKNFLEDILEEMGRLTDLSLALAYTNSPSRLNFFRRGEPCVRPGRWANTRLAPTFNPLLNATQYYTPATALNFFKKLAPADVLLFPQEGADLSEGFETVLVRNSDSPDLPGEVVAAGRRALETHGADLVLGPNPDGGYYLVGLKKSQPQLFQGISWSSPNVLADTLDRARELSLSPYLLPSWPDIDTIADLRAFAARPPLPDRPGRGSYRCARELLAALPTKN